MLYSKLKEESLRSRKENKDLQGQVEYLQGRIREIPAGEFIKLQCRFCKYSWEELPMDS